MKDWSEARLKNWSQTVFGFEPERLDSYSNIIFDVQTSHSGELVKAFEFVAARVLFVGSLTWDISLRFSSPGVFDCRTLVARSGLLISSGNRYVADGISMGPLPVGRHDFSGYDENRFFTSLITQNYGGIDRYKLSFQFDGRLLYYAHDIFKKFASSDYPQRFFTS